MQTSGLSRRSLLGAFGALTFAGASRVKAQTLPTVAVHKDPTCGCCGAWVDHLRGAGFQVSVTESAEMAVIKARLGVPQKLASCHTAEVGGYVIEGHVPADEIKRLLAERPLGKGLAVPGMPVGSPGMEVAGANPDRYEVVLFGPEGQRTFARYVGAKRA